MWNLLVYSPREDDNDCADEHRDTEDNDRYQERTHINSMIDDSQDRCKNEDSEWIERPLMSNISSLHWRFSRCNDDGDIQQHVNDDWEDFCDDSKSDIRLVGNLL